ncbi:MAG: sulfotransferase domain-containing protein [Gammaproteobacteria bacterium]|nr:sulfotransferase domain-containing protein [Gammaproteobacteria bacterium]
MKILQIGMPKSGNFWLYTIIQNILKQSNIQIKSHITQTKEFRDIKDLKLSTKAQNTKDVIDIEDDDIYYRVSSIIKQPIIDFDTYIDNITHVWTHSYITKKSDYVISKFDKVVYIIRDPRDTLVSMSQFVMTDYMKKYYPNDYISSQEYIDSKHQTHSKQWFEHITEYLGKRYPNLHVVFYENLLLEFDEELKKLISFLEINLSEQDYIAIKKETSAYEMIKHNPNHVNLPELYKWKKRISTEQNKAMTTFLTDILLKLNYNLFKDEKNKLPNFGVSLNDLPNIIETYKLICSSLKTENKNYSFSILYNNFFDQILPLIESNKKFVIYGSGKIGKTIFSLLNKNSLVFVDKKSNLKYTDKIERGAIYQLNALKEIEYDNIIITALGRETNIARYLVKELNINPNKIIIIKI